MTRIDWENITNYIESVGTTDTVFPFVKAQSSVKVTSSGANDNIIYTIGGQSGTLLPGQSVTVTGTISSMTLRSASGRQPFQVWATEAGTEKDETDTSYQGQIDGLTTQLAERAAQSDLNATNAALANKLDKGKVTVADIDKNQGKFDQTYMADSLLQQIAGTTPVNAVPADKTITKVKIADKAISFEHISDDIKNKFSGYSIYSKLTDTNSAYSYVDCVFDLASIKASLTTNDKYNVLYDFLAADPNIITLGSMVWLNNDKKPGNYTGGSYFSNEFSMNVNMGRYATYNAIRENYADNAYSYVHVLLLIKANAANIFKTFNLTNIKLLIGSNQLSIVDIGLANSTSDSTFKRLDYINYQPMRYDNLYHVVTNDKSLKLSNNLLFKNTLKENINNKSDMFSCPVTVGQKSLLAVYMFDINSVLSTVTFKDKYEFQFDFYSNDDSAITLKTNVWCNNDSTPGNLSTADNVSFTTEYPLTYIKGTRGFYDQVRETVDKRYRYVKLLVWLDTNNTTAHTIDSYVLNPKLIIQGNVFTPSNPVLYATTGTIQNNQLFPLNGVDANTAKQLISGITVPSKWSGKTWNAMGDSITDKTNVTATLKYAEVIAGKINVTVNNYGIGGTGLLEDGTQPAMYKRIDGMTTNADLITVFGGTNDWNVSLHPLGSFGDSPDLAASPTTIYGCIDWMCRKLISKYPTKIIAFLTPLPRDNNRAANSQGFTLEDVANAMVKVCNMYSIPVLDLYHLSNMYPFNTDFKTAMMPDGLHPNDSGHLVLADKVLSFINKL